MVKEPFFNTEFADWYLNSLIPSDYRQKVNISEDETVSYNAHRVVCRTSEPDCALLVIFILTNNITKSWYDSKSENIIVLNLILVS